MTVETYSINGKKGDSGKGNITLPEEFEARLTKIMARYPDKRSAVMPALYLAQEHFGYITDDGVAWVSARVGLSPVHVREIATFYTMYYKKPVGKYHVQICRTLSCAINGAKHLTAHMHTRTGVNPGEVTEDGMWSYEEVECLGSCGTAPMCEINDTYFENLTPEKLDEILNLIEQTKPDLRYSTKNDDFGKGIPGRPKSAL